MLSLEEGKMAVAYARDVIEGHVRGEVLSHAVLTPTFDGKAGAFVTLNTFPDKQLRGCIGVPEPVMPLRKAIQQGAQSATHDPRFPALIAEELDGIIVEVTVLTPPEKIIADTPEALIDAVVIGRDGLIAERGGLQRGLLLPQVPVEHGWDEPEYLSHTCMKAGLSPFAWRESEVTFYRFEGEIFTETEPSGPVEHQGQHGSD